jgi:HEAT repeat protein/cyclophilin family peptidyl-prolyl cis-trans isomerase
MLRLEDSRTLRDPAPPPPAAPPPAERGRRSAAPVAPPPPVPDLTRLAADPEPRVRRRAALAIGRVGLREGSAALLPLLKDADAEVRQMAAFALGLIGDPSAREPLVALLSDPSPLVQGSAAEALGLIGDDAAADAVGRLAAAIVASGALTPPPAADDDRRDTPAGAFRQALNALVRLRAYPHLAAAVLDGAGQPRVRWWPVAYALQRIENPGAVPALIALSSDPDPYTRAFAARGLGPLKDRAAVPALIALVNGPERAPAIQAIRSLGQLGDRAASAALLKIITTPKADPHLRLEAVSAIGGVGGEGVSEILQDLLGDPKPPVRAAAIRSLARLDAESFMFVLSGLDPDSHWSVRAELATVLGTLPAENALPRLRQMLDDDDYRAIPAVLAALAALKAEDAAALAVERLKADDPVVRVAAANALGALKSANAGPALIEAYRFGDRDTTYVARAAALAALVAVGAPEAAATLKDALDDKDWAVRVRAAALLRDLEPGFDAEAAIRPAPLRRPVDAYSAPGLANPPYSTQAFIETDRGTIQIELAVLDAPSTVDSFVSLARRGFFDGVTFHRVVPDFVIQGGDPRGDGEGGPGYTIRDELNQRSYLRGTVGMALDWEDTGGSQFFITHSPQPHLDARYTVFGRVLDGMPIVDQIEPWDVIRRVRVWDGER